MNVPGKSQFVLIDAPAPAQSHSATSIDAAQAVATRITAQQAQVLQALREHGPMTDEAIQRTTGLAANSERPRRIELHRRGLIRIRGEGVTRSGRKAVAWDLVPATPPERGSEHPAKGAHVRTTATTPDHRHRSQVGRDER